VSQPAPSPAAVRPVAGISLWQDAYRRLRRERLAVACFFVVVAYVLVALLAKGGQLVNSLHEDGTVGDGAKHVADAVLFASYTQSHDDAREQPPSLAHPFGTNVHGQDVLARIANGAGIAIWLGLSVAAIAVLIGTFLGSIAGWFGKWVDDGVVWLYSTVSSIPDVMLIMGLAFVMGQTGGRSARSLSVMMLAMGLTYWVGVARIVRGEFLRLKDRDYVLAARALGFGNGRIMFGHVAPNVAHVLIVLFTLLFVEAIKAEVVLSFLGVGLTNEPSWGIIVQDAENGLMVGQWWEMTFTSVALFGIVLALQVFGDALRDALDPRLRH
jgi:ABC-type dipeptide/oligopeptide/nickel transport system permease subunit